MAATSSRREIQELQRKIQMNYYIVELVRGKNYH